MSKHYDTKYYNAVVKAFIIGMQEKVAEIREKTDIKCDATIATKTNNDYISSYFCTFANFKQGSEKKFKKEFDGLTKLLHNNNDKVCSTEIAKIYGAMREVHLKFQQDFSKTISEAVKYSESNQEALARFMVRCKSDHFDKNADAQNELCENFFKFANTWYFDQTKLISFDNNYNLQIEQQRAPNKDVTAVDLNEFCAISNSLTSLQIDDHFVQIEAHSDL